jgi:hypothetical protein
VPPFGIDRLDRLEDPVRARDVVVPGHHRPPARLFDRLGDGRGVGRDGDRSDAGLAGAAPDMHDHRFAEDVGERLLRQPRRLEARRNEDDRIGHGEAQRFWDLPAA